MVGAFTNPILKLSSTIKILRMLINFKMSIVDYKCNDFLKILLV